MSRQKNNSHESKTFREQFSTDINGRFETLGRNLSSLAACIIGFHHHAVATIASLFYQKYNQKYIPEVIYE